MLIHNLYLVTLFKQFGLLAWFQVVGENQDAYREGRRFNLIPTYNAITLQKVFHITLVGKRELFSYLLGLNIEVQVQNIYFISTNYGTN